jgi:hypothetical protein
LLFYHIYIYIYKLLLIIRWNDIDSLTLSTTVIMCRLITSALFTNRISIGRGEDLNGYAYQSFYCRQL